MKIITPSQADIITALIDGQKTPSRLTPLVTFGLTRLGCLDAIDGKLVLAPKAAKLLKKYKKAELQNECDTQVHLAFIQLYVDEHTALKHRTVWEHIGVTKFSRDMILKSLQFWRRAGLLSSHKVSNNNFQILWKLTIAHAPVIEVADEDTVPAEFQNLADMTDEEIENAAYQKRLAEIDAEEEFQSLTGMVTSFNEITQVLTEFQTHTGMTDEEIEDAAYQKSLADIVEQTDI